MASRDRYSGTGGRGQPLSIFRFASRSTTLTIGEVAAASGSAATLKRGATGKPFCTFAFIASGEGIQAIASNASSPRPAIGERGLSGKERYRAPVPVHFKDVGRRELGEPVQIIEHPQARVRLD